MIHSKGSKLRKSLSLGTFIFSKAERKGRNMMIYTLAFKTVYPYFRGEYNYNLVTFLGREPRIIGEQH